MQHISRSAACPMQQSCRLLRTVVPFDQKCYKKNRVSCEITSHTESKKNDKIWFNTHRWACPVQATLPSLTLHSRAHSLDRTHVAPDGRFSGRDVRATLLRPTRPPPHRTPSVGSTATSRPSHATTEPDPSRERQLTVRVATFCLVVDDTRVNRPSSRHRRPAFTPMVERGRYGGALGHQWRDGERVFSRRGEAFIRVEPGVVFISSEQVLAAIVRCPPCRPRG